MFFFFFFASGIHVETNLPEIQDNVTYNCSGCPRNETNPARHVQPSTGETAMERPSKVRIPGCKLEYLDNFPSTKVL